MIFTSVTTNIRLMSVLFLDFFRVNPLQVSLTLLLMLFRSMSSGVGLLLILPLLQVVGLIDGTHAVSGFSKELFTIFNRIHLSVTLLSVLFIYVLIVSFVALTGFAEQIISARLQQYYIHQLRTKLYRQLLHTEWSFFIKRKLSDFLHTLTVQVQSIAASNFQLLMLLNQFTLACVYIGLAFLLSWQMTLVAAICALLLLSMVLPLHRLTSQSGRDHLKQNQTIFQTLSEQLSALKTIKSAGFEDAFLNLTLKVSTSLEDQNQRLTLMMAVTRLLYACGAVLAFSILLYFSIEIFKVPTGSLLLLLIIFSRLLPMVSNAQQVYQRLLHQLPAFFVVLQLLNDCNDNQEGLQSNGSVIFKESIVFDRVSFSYLPGPVDIPYFDVPLRTINCVIENFSMVIKKNTTTAIIGPSGVGKSTLADLMVGLLEPTTGRILIDHHALDSQNKLAWRKSVAYVNQDVFLFNATIRENMQLFCQQQSDEALWEALRLVAASDFVADLEHGLDTIIGDRGVRLSGGECQRIALARALLAKPALLILDESTSALDSHNIRKIQEALSQLRGKMTIIIISHQTEMCNFADQKIVLTMKGMIHDHQDGNKFTSKSH